MSPPSHPFFWGASTSGYQHEGGYNGPGQPQNNWSEWERSGRVETTGRSIDFWNRFPEDLDRAAALGLNSFRIGLEWTRLQPEPKTRPDGRPQLEPQAVQRYGEILVACRQRGLEPLVTLLHFTHPAWMGADPWLDPEMPTRFEKFVREAVEQINEAMITKGEDPVRWWLTINEPNMLVLNAYLSRTFPAGPRTGVAPLIQAITHLLVSHIRAYRAVHAVYEKADWERPQVSFNNYASDLYWMDKMMTDLVSAPHLGVLRGDLAWWLVGRARRFNERFDKAKLPLTKTLPYWMGWLIKRLLDGFGHRILETGKLERMADAIYAEGHEMPLDYIAFDYYDPFVGNIFRLPRFEEMAQPGQSLRGRLLNSVTSKTWDWPALPQGLSFFVHVYQEDFAGKRIIIAENGMARLRKKSWTRSWRRDQLRRSVYLDRHLAEVAKLIQEQSPLAGYFHWSLTDNYEWGSYAPKFGLFEVDLQAEDLPRKAVDSAGLNAAETYRSWIERFQSGFKGDVGSPQK